jgi:CO/xanthine dehydrogenase FAD-binding subunit
MEVSLEVLLDGSFREEIVTLHVPLSAGERLHWGTARVARTPADDAIVSAFAAVGVANGVVQRARLALTGVSPGTVYLADAANDLVNTELNEERIRQVAAGVEQQITPERDFLGSAEYRRAMAGVLARRALEECLKKEAA